MTGFKNFLYMAVSLSFFLFTYSPVNSYALQISQEEFKDSYMDGKTEMVLMGAALKRFLEFKAIAVAFYLEKGKKEEDVLKEIPKRIEIACLQKITKEELVQETLAGMKDNLEEGKFTAMDIQIQQLTGWYKDMEEGDRFTFTYRPGAGTQIDLNDVKLGVIEGKDFAYGLFSIYVGAKPSDIRAKRKLLGRMEIYQ
jgi:hypothetical protein